MTFATESLCGSVPSLCPDASDCVGSSVADCASPPPPSSGCYPAEVPSLSAAPSSPAAHCPPQTYRQACSRTPLLSDCCPAFDP